MSRGTKPSEEIVNAAIADYQAGGSMSDTGEKYGMSGGWLYHVLKRAGIKARPKTPPIRYALDEHFFDAIDSHEKAICLGFIWADGSIGQTGGKNSHLRIMLSNVDLDYLEWVNQLMQNERPICMSGRFAVLIAYHPQIVAGLLGLGVYERKSVTIGFPTSLQVPDEFLSSFLLGVFEGDGSIGLTGKQAWCNIVGSEAFCHTLHDLLAKRLNIETYIGYKPTKCGRRIARIAVKGNRQIVTFMDWLYSKAPHVMRRKHERYLQLKSFYDADGQWIYSAEQIAEKKGRLGKHMTGRAMSEAQRAINGRPKKFHVKSPTGEVHLVESIRSFCRKTDLKVSNLTALFKGERSSYKGWTIAPSAQILPLPAAQVQPPEQSAAA